MNNLQRLRNEHRETQRQLADHCGITERGFRKIENGESKPSCDVIIKLQRRYNTTIDYLLQQADEIA